MMSLSEFYKALNKVENAFVREQLKKLAQHLEKIEKYMQDKAITKKDAEYMRRDTWKAIKDFIEEYKVDLGDITRTVYFKAGSQAGAELGAAFRGIPKESLEWFEKNFLPMQETIMKNYAGDLMRIVENRLAVAIMNGDNIYRVTRDLLKEIPNSGKRRITVMVRDQLGRAMQMGIYNTYKVHEDVIKAYKWVGPSDGRTTKWCRNRKALTAKKPWTPEEIERYIRKNPKKLGGLEITDPRTGSFLHPHIQCRHRLVVVRRSIKAIVKSS